MTGKYRSTKNWTHITKNTSKVQEKDCMPLSQIKQLLLQFCTPYRGADLSVLRINSLLDPRSQVIHTIVTC